MSNNDGKMSFDLNVSINEVMNQDSVREVTNQIKKQKEEIEQPIKISISDKDAKNRLKQLEKVTKKLERDLGKAIQSNNYSDMSVLAENISDNKEEMKQLQEIVDKHTKSIKKQSKATQELIDKQKKLQRAYTDSRKAYEVEFSDGKKMYFPTKDKAQRHVENVNSLSGNNTSRYKREVYLRNLSQQDRDSFEKIYYKPSPGYKPGSPFQLTGADLDTYISIIEGLEDFQNQYNRLTKMKHQGNMNASIRPNKGLLDQLNQILNGEKTISEQERELIERILVHRTEDLDVLERLINTGKRDVSNNKKSSAAKMAEFYEHPDSPTNTTDNIEEQTKNTEKQTNAIEEQTKKQKEKNKELQKESELLKDIEEKRVKQNDERGKTPLDEVEKEANKILKWFSEHRNFHNDYQKTKEFFDMAKEKSDELREDAETIKVKWDNVSNVMDSYIRKNVKSKKELQEIIKEEWKLGHHTKSAKLFDEYKKRFSDGKFDPSKLSMFKDNKWAENFTQNLATANVELSLLEQQLFDMAHEYAKYIAYISLDDLFFNKSSYYSQIQSIERYIVLKQKENSLLEQSHKLLETTDKVKAQENLNKLVDEYNKQIELGNYLLDEKEKRVERPVSDIENIPGYDSSISPAMNILKLNDKMTEAFDMSHHLIIVIKEAIKVAEDLGIDTVKLIGKELYDTVLSFKKDIFEENRIEIGDSLDREYADAHVYDSDFLQKIHSEIEQYNSIKERNFSDFINYIPRMFPDLERILSTQEDNTKALEEQTKELNKNTNTVKSERKELLSYAGKPVKIFDLLNLKPNFLQDVFLYLKLTLEDIYKKQIDGEDMSFSIVHKNGASEYIYGNEVHSTNEQGIISSKSLLDLSKQEFAQLLKNVVYMGVQGDGNNFDTQFGNLDEYAINDSNLKHNSTQYLELYDSYVRKMYKDKYELDAYAKMSAKEIEAEQKAIEKYENSVLNGEQVNNYFEDIQDNIDKTSLSLSEFISLLKDLDFAQSQSLLNLINNLMNSKYQISDEVQNILYNMHLLDQNNKFIGKFTDQGFSNRGVVMSDQYAVIGRRPDYYSEMDDQDVYNFQFDSSDSYLDNLIAKMEIAKQNGIGLSRILKVIKSESEFSNGTLYEIQELAPGNPAHIMGYSKTLENFIIENQRLISATDDQIIKLMNDVVELNSMGFQFDFGTGNILYDTQKGFTLIDLSLREIDQKIPKTEDLIRRLFDAVTGLSDNDYRFLETIDNFNVEENPKWVEQISSVFNRFHDALSNSKYKDFLEEGSRKFYDYKEKYNQTLNQLNNQKQMPRLQEFINSLSKKYGENDFNLLFDEVINSMILTEETAAELYSKLEKREQEYLDSHTRNVHAFIEQQKYMREQQQLLFEHQDDKEFMEQYFSISQKIGEGFLSSGEGNKELNNFVVSRNSNSDDILESPSELELVKDILSRLSRFSIEQEQSVYASKEWHQLLESLNIAGNKITLLTNDFVDVIRSTMFATEESESENLTERLFNLLTDKLLNEARDVNILDDIYNTFLNFAKGVKIYYNDAIKAAYGDDWKGFYSKHKNNLRATKTSSVLGADEFVETASNEGFSSFFSDVISGSDIDQFKKIFDVLDYIKSLPKDSNGNFIEYKSYDKHRRDEISEQLSFIYAQIATKTYQSLHNIETNTETAAKNLQETTKDSNDKSQSKNSSLPGTNFSGNSSDEDENGDKDDTEQKPEQPPIFRIPLDESLKLLREAQNDRKDLVDLSSVLDINDLQGTLKDLIPDIYGEDYKLDRVHLSENIATLVISNEKLGKRIIQTYQHRDNTNEDTGVENVDFFKLADDLVIDLKQARRVEEKDSKKALADENWLNNKFNQLVNQEINAKSSSKKVNLDTKLYAPEATSFQDEVEHTIGDLVDSIRNSITTALSSGLTTELRNTIERDLGALKNELKVAYTTSHVSTEMTPTAFEEVKHILESTMKQLVANAKKNGTYEQLSGSFEKLEKQRNSLTKASQVSDYVDAERSLKKEIAAANAEQDLQKSKFREILDLTNRLERATDLWQQQYKDGRSTKVQDEEIVYYNQRLAQLKKEVQLTEDQQTQLDNIHAEHAQKRRNIELDSQQKQKDAVLKMQEQMQTAATEIQTKTMQLSKYQDLPEYDDVWNRLDKLATAYKNFTEAGTVEEKTKYFNEYQENYRILKAEMQNLSEIQKMNNQETKAETASIQNYYSTILNLIKEIASYDSKIQNLQLKGKPEFLPFIKVLETQKQKLIENARSVISEMQNSIGTSGLEGENPVQLPLTNILQNIDDKNSLQNFLRDAGVQAVLTSKQIDDLTNVLLKAQNATDEYGAKLQELTTHRMDLYQSLNGIFSKNDLNKNNEYVSGVNNIKDQIKSLNEKNIGKATSEWSSEDITQYQFLIEELEKYKKVLESATDKERAFFAGKEKFTKTTNFKTFDEKEFESADKYNTIQQKLIESARQFAKQSSNSDAIITKFVTDANGISKLDFSVFDEGTKSLRSFTIASGQFLNGIYLSEQSTNGFLNNIKKGTAQIQNIQNILNKVQLSDTISFDQPIVRDLLSLQKQLGDEISKGKGADQTVLSKLISDSKIATSELDKLYKKHLQFQNANMFKNIDMNGDIYGQAIAMMNEYANTTGSTVTQIGKFNQANNTMKFTMVDTSGTVKDVQISLDRLGGSLVAQERTIKSYSSKWAMLKDQFGKMGRQLLSATIGYNVFYKVIGEFRKGYGYVKQIDKAMTELKKVTDETEMSYQKFLKNTSNTASQIGSTVSDFVEATANFARLGYTMDEASDMANSAIVYKNVADGLNSVDEATGSIISTMKAFGIESSDTMSIVDKFNEVGNKFAITSAGIGDSLKRSASALYAAGNTIDESIGLITAANSVVQNPEQVGTALKTLSLRLRGAKTELEDANLETENMAETTAQLQKKLLGLTHGKVDILLDPDTFKSTTQILREMSAAWEDMTDMERAAALELMGGKRQANILSSIITNFDTVENVIKTSADSAGSALKENEKYLDSIQGKTDLLKNSQQTMWNNALNSSFMKFLLDVLNTLTKIVDKVGLFNTLIAAGVAKTAFSSKNLFGNFFVSNGSGMKLNSESLFGKMFNKKDTDNYSNSLRVLGTSTIQATDGVQTLSLVTRQQGQAAKQSSDTNTVLSGTANAVGSSAATASFGVRLLNSALSMGLSLLIGFTIGKVIEGFYDLAHQAEYLKEEVNELTDSYKESQKTINDNLNTLEKLGSGNINNLVEEFDKLSTGVDKNGKNIGLTSDEFLRYQDICEEIIGINPELMDGYDSATVAIKNQASSLQQLIDLQKEEARQNAFELVNEENLEKIMQDKINDIKDIQEDLQALKQYNGAGDIYGINSLLAKLYYGNDENSGATQKEFDEFILTKLGYNENEVKNLLQKYYTDLGAYNSHLIDDFADEIASKASVFKSVEVIDWSKKWKNTKNEFEKAKNSMIQTFLQVPLSIEGYDDLNQSTKTFITKWIQNSNLFKIDENTVIDDVLAAKQKIIDIMSGFIKDIQDGGYFTENDSGVKISAENIIDSLINLDSTTVNWEKYKQESQKLIEMLWKAIGGENNTFGWNDKTQMGLELGFDFAKQDQKEAEVVKKYAELQGISEEAASDYFNNLPPLEVKRILALNWNLITNKQELDDAINGIVFDDSKFNLPFDELLAKLENFDSVIEKTKNIFNDNTIVTQEYKDSLSELGLTAEELAPYFDEVNPLLVRNAKGLLQLVKNTKKASEENIKLSKSQAKLKYYQLYKEMHNLKGQKVDSINLIYSEMTALQKVISKYDILEKELLGVSSAYKEMEEAKQIDELNNYDDKASEMVQILLDGFNSGKLGTASVQAAIKGLIPDEIIENATTLEEKMDAIFNYLNQKTLPFKIEVDEDGVSKVEMNLDTMKSSFEYLKKQGIFVGEWENFDLSSDITSLNDFAERAGWTMDFSLGYLQGLEKYDISFLDGDITTLLDKLPVLSDELYNVKKEMKELFPDTVIDLENRPVISATEMNEKGYGLEDNEYATVHSMGFDSSDFFDKNGKAITQKNGEGYQLLVTPILPDRTVLSENELRDYIQDQLNNGKKLSELEVVLGTYTTIDEADEAGQKLHELQEKQQELSNKENLDLNIFKTIEALSQLDYQLANGKITDEEYNTKLLQLRDTLNILSDSAYDQVIEFSNINKEIATQKDIIDNSVAAINNMKNKGIMSDEEILSSDAYKNLQVASKELAVLLQQKELLVEPTDMIIRIVRDNKLAPMQNELKSMFGDKVEFDDTGKMILHLTFETLNEEQLKAVQDYSTLWEDIHKIEVDADANNAQTALETIEQSAQNALDVIKKIDNTTIEIKIEGIDKLTTLKNTLLTILGMTGVHFNVQKPSSTGTSNANGSDGIKENETSLVGELGPEMLVRNGRWHLVGQDGAEFTDVKRGDIIFNHRQTKELLSSGKISGRGKAFAEGNAFVGGVNTYDKYYKDVGKHLSNATGDISDSADKFQETFDWIEIRFEEIDKDLQIVAANIENAITAQDKNTSIDEAIDLNNLKLINLQAGSKEYDSYAAKLLEKVPERLRDAAKNGAISIQDFAGEEDEKTVKAIEEFREWRGKADDAKLEIVELQKEIESLAVQKFDNIHNEFDNMTGSLENANNKLQTQVDLIESQGLPVSEKYYESMKQNSLEQGNLLNKEKEQLQNVLDTEVQLGHIKVGSDEWYNLIEQISQVDEAIISNKKDLEDFQNSINETRWNNFDELMKQMDYLESETQNLIDIMNFKDLVDETGEYTNEGITALGLHAQKMELAVKRTQELDKAISDLEAHKDDYSESEYNEKMNELVSAQYDSIKAHDQEKKAIVEINKQRVEAIKTGIEKEIDAYAKLIEKKKEELSSEKDLYDFQKSTMEQQKNISDIKRKLAALANDNSSSALAQKKRLQAELAEAESQLDDSYYDRSVTNRQNALDQEQKDFEENKNKEIERLEETLKNEEKLVFDSLNLVQNNTSVVLDTLQQKADQYGLTIAESLKKPWQIGETAISDYMSNFINYDSEIINELEKIEQAWQAVIDKMTEAAKLEIKKQENDNSRYGIATQVQTSKKTQQESSNQSTNSNSANNNKSVDVPDLNKGSSIVVKTSAKYFSSNSKNQRMASYVPGGTYTVYEKDGDQVLIGKNGQYTGWINKTDIEGFASGTNEIKKNQLAFIDELGEELVMHADGNGKLSFLSKGSSVIPHDITENLMKIGQLDPSHILDKSKPTITSPIIEDHSIEIHMDIAEVVHIDTVDHKDIPDLSNTVQKALDGYMKQLNNNLRKYAR